MKHERLRPARRGRLRRWLRSAVAVCVTFTAVGAAALVPATAAHASDGTGWHWSWNYYDPTTFALGGGLTDVSFLANGSDNTEGDRQVSGTLVDANAYDGRCAMIELSTRHGLLLQRLACSGSSRSFSTGSFNDDLIVTLYRVYFEGGGMHVDQSYQARIRTSRGDPNLRTAGTGGYWSYIDSSTAVYNLRRPGVSFWGVVYHVTDSTRRAVTGEVSETPRWNGGCARGAIGGADGTGVHAQTCWLSDGPGPGEGYSPRLSHDGLLGNLYYAACSQDGLFSPDFGYLAECLDGNIPMPHTA